MATLDDIRWALHNLIGTELFPNGAGQAPIVSCPGVIKIFPGWPAPYELSLDKIAYPPDGAGNVVIAVQDIGQPRDATRFDRTPRLVSRTSPTLVWTSVANVLTLSGTVSSPQNLAIIVSKGQGQNADFTYAVQPNDTIETIIAAMAALMPGSYDIGVTADSIYFPNASSVIGRVGTFGTYVILTGQYRSTICVAIWCGDDRLRGQLVGLLKPMLDLLTRFTLPDGTISTILGTGREATVTDMEGMGIPSTRLLFELEFSSARTVVLPQITVFRTTLSDAQGVITTQEA